ncbi:MAG: hypothetical protein JEZ09_19400 [Salinivirgaceae bacterium]|nr:hypothetical protein [Salinivirgaceae bacterium]
MLMPSKHINFSQSLLGFGSYLLTKLDKPKSVDDVWKNYQTDLLKENYNAKHSFDNLMLTFIFLFSVNAIEQKNGLIYKCN